MNRGVESLTQLEERICDFCIRVTDSDKQRSGLEGMVVSVESYIGEVDGAEGVKLEEELIITETGVEMLSRYPFDEALLGRQM